MDLIDPDSCFSVEPDGSAAAQQEEADDDCGAKGRRGSAAHTASVTVRSGKQMAFNVTFKPSAACRSQVRAALPSRGKTSS